MTARYTDPLELVGTLPGKYRVQSLVGEGGFAVVYRAVDTTLDRTVALKVLTAHLDPRVQNPEVQARVYATSITWSPSKSPVVRGTARSRRLLELTQEVARVLLPCRRRDGHGASEDALGGSSHVDAELGRGRTRHRCGLFVGEWFGSYGGWSVRTSVRISPSAYTSVHGPVRENWNCSGAAYAGDRPIGGVRVRVSPPPPMAPASIAFAMPNPGGAGRRCARASHCRA
jgi:hypothetical protein